MMYKKMVENMIMENVPPVHEDENLVLWDNKPESVVLGIPEKQITSTLSYNMYEEFREIVICTPVPKDTKDLDEEGIILHNGDNFLVWAGLYHDSNEILIGVYFMNHGLNIRFTRSSWLAFRESAAKAGSPLPWRSGSSLLSGNTINDDL